MQASLKQEEESNYLLRKVRNRRLLFLDFGWSIPSQELDRSRLAALEILLVASLADFLEVTDFWVRTTAPCFFLRELAGNSKINYNLPMNNTTKQ